MNKSLTKTSLLKKVQSLLYSVAGLASVILIWYLGVTYTSVGKLLPTPFEVVERLIYTCTHNIGMEYTLPMHLLISLRRVMTGFLLSIAVGVVLGVAMGRFKMIEAIFRPIYELVRPIPGIAWIPLAIVWFGIGETAKLYIIFMAGFVNIVANTYSGAKNVDESLVSAAYMLGANKVQAFFHIVIPACVPYIFAGMQVGLSICWMAVLAAEMFSAKAGIGWVIVAGQLAGDMTQIFVGVISIAIVGLLLATVMRWLEKILCQWRERGK